MKPTIAALLLATCFSTALAQDRKPSGGSSEPFLDLGRKEGRFAVYVRTRGNILCELVMARLKEMKPAPVDVSLCASTEAALYGIECRADGAPDPMAVAGVLKSVGVIRVSLDAKGPVAVKDGRATFTLEACKKTYVLKNRARRKDEKTDPPDLVGKLENGATPWIRGELQGGALVVESVD